MASRRTSGKVEDEDYGPKQRNRDLVATLILFVLIVLVLALAVVLGWVADARVLIPVIVVGVPIALAQFGVGERLVSYALGYVADALLDARTSRKALLLSAVCLLGLAGLLAVYSSNATDFLYASATAWVVLSLSGWWIIDRVAHAA